MTSKCKTWLDSLDLFSEEELKKDLKRNDDIGFQAMINRNSKLLSKCMEIDSCIRIELDKRK